MPVTLAPAPEATVPTAPPPSAVPSIAAPDPAAATPSPAPDISTPSPAPSIAAPSIAAPSIATPAPSAPAKPALSPEEQLRRARENVDVLRKTLQHDPSGYVPETYGASGKRTEIDQKLRELQDELATLDPASLDPAAVAAKFAPLRKRVVDFLKEFGHDFTTIFDKYKEAAAKAAEQARREAAAKASREARERAEEARRARIERRAREILAHMKRRMSVWEGGHEPNPGAWYGSDHHGAEPSGWKTLTSDDPDGRAILERLKALAAEAGWTFHSSFSAQVAFHKTSGKKNRSFIYHI